MRTERVNREIATVESKYAEAVAVDEPSGSVAVIVPRLPIPPGFSESTARVLVRIPALYPTERLDLFWLSPRLSRIDGIAFPNVMGTNVAIADEHWIQISWHDNSPHDPDRVSVLGFVRGIFQWFDAQVKVAA